MTAAPRWLPDAAIERLREAAEVPDLSSTKYELLGPLARGGMGAIWLARDRELDRRVALKVLAVPGAGPGIAQRMIREARILARLEHPGIVPVHDVGTLPDGRIYYVMKHVKGRSLDQHPILGAGIPERLRTMERICEAVAFAHDRGIVHRDLKPGNIMVGEFGEVLIMDWGIAKILEGEPDPGIPGTASPAGGAGPHGRADLPGGPGDLPAESVTTVPAEFTGHGAVLGTPAWMAPEQARGETARIDARADIYALGAILHFLLVGKPPSDARSPADAIARFESGATGSPRREDPSIPRPLDAICRRAMAQDPARRYALAGEMREDLALHLAGLPPRAHREGIPERVARWARAYRTVILLIAAYLVMRVAVFFWLGR